jgi:hypothetical protein
LPFQVKVNLEDLQNIFIEMTKQNAALESFRYRTID